MTLTSPSISPVTIALISPKMSSSCDWLKSPGDGHDLASDSTGDHVIRRPELIDRWHGPLSCTCRRSSIIFLYFLKFVILRFFLIKQNSATPLLWLCFSSETTKRIIFLKLKLKLARQKYSKLLLTNWLRHRKSIIRKKGTKEGDDVIVIVNCPNKRINKSMNICTESHIFFN